MDIPALIFMVLKHWSYFPDFLKGLWTLIAIVTFGTSVVSINIVLKAQAKTPQEKILLANEEEGYEEVFRTKDPTSTDGSGKIVTQLLKRDDQRDFFSYKVARVHEKSQTRFEYSIILGNRTWRPGSSRLFHTDVGNGKGVEKSLEDLGIGKSVKKSLDVICIGLASHTKSEKIDNNILSHERAINLCRSLINLKFIDEERQDYVAMSFGEGKVLKDDSVNTANQRTAIIIGVSQYSGKDDDKTIISTLTKLLNKETPIAGITLQDFNYYGEPKEFWGFGGGKLEKFEDMILNENEGHRERINSVSK